MEKRTDRHTAVHVDLAVNVSAVFGLSAGVQALHEQQVPLAVVQRALIDRGPRRGANSGRVPESGRKSDFYGEQYDGPCNHPTCR